MKVPSSLLAFGGIWWVLVILKSLCDLKPHLHSLCLPVRQLRFCPLSVKPGWAPFLSRDKQPFCSMFILSQSYLISLDVSSLAWQEALHFVSSNNFHRYCLQLFYDVLMPKFTPSLFSLWSDIWFFISCLFPVLRTNALPKFVRVYLYTSYQSSKPDASKSHTYIMPFPQCPIRSQGQGTQEVENLIHAGSLICPETVFLVTEVKIWDPHHPGIQADWKSTCAA